MEIQGDWTTKLRRPVAVKLNVFFNPKVLYFISLGRKSSLGVHRTHFWLPNSSLDLVAGTSDSMSWDRWTVELAWCEDNIQGTSLLLEPRCRTWTSKGEASSSRAASFWGGSWRLEVGAAVRKDFGTPGLGKMSTFFQKWSGTNLWDYWGLHYRRMENPSGFLHFQQTVSLRDQCKRQRSSSC